MKVGLIFGAVCFHIVLFFYKCILIFKQSQVGDDRLWWVQTSLIEMTWAAQNTDQEVLLAAFLSCIFVLLLQLQYNFWMSRASHIMMALQLYISNFWKGYANGAASWMGQNSQYALTHNMLASASLSRKPQIRYVFSTIGTFRSSVIVFYLQIKWATDKTNRMSLLQLHRHIVKTEVNMTQVELWLPWKTCIRKRMLAVTPSIILHWVRSSY